MVVSQLGIAVPSQPVEGYESVSHAHMKEMLESGLVEMTVHTASHTIASVLEPMALQVDPSQCRTAPASR